MHDEWCSSCQKNNKNPTHLNMSHDWLVPYNTSYSLLQSYSIYFTSKTSPTAEVTVHIRLKPLLSRSCCRGNLHIVGSSSTRDEVAIAQNGDCWCRCGWPCGHGSFEWLTKITSLQHFCLTGSSNPKYCWCCRFRRCHPPRPLSSSIVVNIHWTVAVLHLRCRPLWVYVRRCPPCLSLSMSTVIFLQCPSSSVVVCLLSSSTFFVWSFSAVVA